MEINLYPSFDEVFSDNELKGIFYPLCTIKTNLNTIIHFVSSNGLWMDENYTTTQNSFSFTIFQLTDCKYSFSGDIRLYKGYQNAKSIIEYLENDFRQNGKKYLENKTTKSIYSKNLKTSLDFSFNDDFDSVYYLETFYEYSINKLYYEKTGEFGMFNHIIEGWGKPEKSPIIYTKEQENDNLDFLNDSKVSENITKEKYDFIGRTIGYEFFTDGNDTVVFYNKSGKILSLNSYS